MRPDRLHTHDSADSDEVALRRPIGCCMRRVAVLTAVLGRISCLSQGDGCRVVEMFQRRHDRAWVTWAT